MQLASKKFKAVIVNPLPGDCKFVDQSSARRKVANKKAKIERLCKITGNILAIRLIRPMTEAELARQTERDRADAQYDEMVRNPLNKFEDNPIRQHQAAGIPFTRVTGVGLPG